MTSQWRHRGGWALPSASFTCMMHLPPSTHVLPYSAYFLFYLYPAETPEKADVYKYDTAAVARGNGNASFIGLSDRIQVSLATVNAVVVSSCDNISDISYSLTPTPSSRPVPPLNSHIWDRPRRRRHVCLPLIVRRRTYDDRTTQHPLFRL